MSIILWFSDLNPFSYLYVIFYIDQLHGFYKLDGHPLGLIHLRNSVILFCNLEIFFYSLHFFSFVLNEKLEKFSSIFLHLSLHPLDECEPMFRYSYEGLSEDMHSWFFLYDEKLAARNEEMHKVWRSFINLIN